MERPWHRAGLPIVAGLTLLLSAAASGARGQTAGSPPATGGWRAELADQLLRPWTRHARDTVHGAFRTHLDRRWRPAGPPEKYPSMLGRHLFSFSAGYLLTGEERWLARADTIYRYLVDHAWDGRHGGWFDRLARSGEPADRRKSTFVQVYAATGLALYHFVTRRPEVLRRIRRTNRLLETRFRDREHGGYFQQLARDFTVLDSSKTAASQLAPVSGHLLYLYAGTRDTALLRQAERLTLLAARRMRDPETGWIRERFTPSWEPAPGSEPEVFNVGHNVEVAWLLARLHLAGAGRLAGPDRSAVSGAASSVGPGSPPSAGDSLRRRALELGERVAASGWREESGAWIQKVTRPEAAPGAPPPDSGRVLWWIQAYGNMTQLTLHRISGDGVLPGAPGTEAARPSAAPGRLARPGPGAALGRYREGVEFWRRHLLDRRYGASVTAVGPGGGIRDGGKGGKWKTSYHSVEHALWNRLGEALWLSPGRGVTLHFRPAAGGDGADARRRICPRLVPDPAVVVRSVRRGERTLAVDPAAACFGARAGGPPVRVELAGRREPSP